MKHSKILTQQELDKIFNTEKITIELSRQEIDLIFKMSDECGSYGEFWDKNWYKKNRKHYRSLIMKTINYSKDIERNKRNYDDYIKKWESYKKE